MREIKVWIHDDCIYQEPHYIMIDKYSDIQKYITEWKEVLYPVAKEKNADHFLYATIISKDSIVQEINIYDVALDDEEFYKRTDNVYLYEKEKGNSVSFYAWHKGTSY